MSLLCAVCRAPLGDNEPLRQTLASELAHKACRDRAEPFLADAAPEPAPEAVPAPTPAPEAVPPPAARDLGDVIADMLHAPQLATEQSHQPSSGHSTPNQARDLGDQIADMLGAPELATTAPAPTATPAPQLPAGWTAAELERARRRFGGPAA